uniref:Uncharacterized protein n=1 Tax=Oryza meridionalis TaxID=40149 RepID=A0A0E0F922_9ORYZ
MEMELDWESRCAAPCEKKRLIPSCFEWGTVSATKKMKTDEDLEVLLAYPSLGEGKKKKKVVKRLGKEEVERLLLVTVAVPTVSKKVLSSDVVPARHKEILLQAVDSIKNSAVTIRQRQGVIRAQFEAKGYVHVLAEASTTLTPTKRCIQCN